MKPYARTRTVREWGWGLALVLTLALTALAALQEQAGRQVCGDTLRLHILANSDTWEDQRTKLAVRDAVLAQVAAAVSGCETCEQADAALRPLLPALAAAARRAAGGQTVTLRLDVEAFDARDYGRFALPAGRYRTLRIELGRAAGRNWFCVLYPTLCVSGAQARYDSAAENALVFGRYQVRSAALDAVTGLVQRIRTS